ncbi:bifunctional DNA primase/polymerase [Ktedonospora formicarum]|uniref:DNA primase/polymerase bifunctional N-terminal domain-containing protein n=1 Tax=Ktedonospora formicarum TaxID=2778364 RepID=A0A8J3I5S7_9CHLR|nr:bifunctional DNA primase/polymerase [Ktedonospora formicarum]GHO50852.1 hypothetical protein KSX_90150 [Ktedonospora formicarum]
MTASKSSPSSFAVYQTALAALRARISFIPIVPDGRKAPAVRWKPYQVSLPTLNHARTWFYGKDHGIAFLTGSVSGGLEMLDFDAHDIYAQFVERVRQEELTALLEKIEQGYKELSPRGVHLYYRCRVIEGSKKLAQCPLKAPPWVESTIETRGEGGYGIGAPSSGGVHPSGRPYRVVQGDLSTIVTITVQERALLHAVARTLDKIPPPVHQPPRIPSQQSQGRRPGTIFNEQATWSEILEPYGWTWVKKIGQEDFWRRPGKTLGISATTNFEGSGYLYVFSTSTPFVARVGIDKFGAYTILAHQGDFASSTKALVAQGYVEV